MQKINIVLSKGNVLALLEPRGLVINQILISLFLLFQCRVRTPWQRQPCQSMMQAPSPESAPVPAVARAVAAVVLAFVRALEGPRPLPPLPVVAAVVPVLLGRVRVIPGLALGPRAGLFPLVAVSVGALQVLPGVLGFQVGRAVVVMSSGTFAVTAGPTSGPRAVRPGSTPPVVVMPSGSMRSRAGARAGPGPTGTSTVSTSLAVLPNTIVRAFGSLRPVLRFLFDGFHAGRDWRFLLRLDFSG